MVLSNLPLSIHSTIGVVKAGWFVSLFNTVSSYASGAFFKFLGSRVVCFIVTFDRFENFRAAWLPNEAGIKFLYPMPRWLITNCASATTSLLARSSMFSKSRVEEGREEGG